MTAVSPPRPPSRWRFFLVAALTPVALVSLVGWTGAEYARSVTAQEQAAHSFARERAQLVLLSAVKDAEAAQRDLLLSGDPAFLAPYAAARAASRRLRMDGGASATAIAWLVDARLAALDAAVAAFRAGDPAAARRAVAAGRQVMGRLRAAVAHATAAERAHAARHLAALRRHRDDSYQLMVVTGGVFSLLLLAITAALWRSRCDRYDAALATHDIAERNAAILAGTSDTMLIVDPSGSIEMVNAAGHALLGYAPGELDGRDLATVLRLEGVDGDPAGGATRRAMLTEQVARRRDGGELTVDVAVGTMHMPDGVHLVLSLRDASDRRRLERARDELISTVSHELRTPLTSVVGSLALLRAATQADWTVQARRLVDIADNNARRLIRLINDMLEIDRLEGGQLPIARLPVDLRTVTAQAALDGEGLAHGRGVTLVDDPAAAPVMVAGDAGRLLQVVANLVSNAVQASAGGDRVTLRARVVQGRATVSVEDRGPGIPDALRPRLFRRFQSQRTSGGTGLGLAISREIVRRLDGTIRFEDRVGGGTRFVFDLPLLPPDRAIPPDDGSLPVVLHVEDDPDLRETVAAALAGVATVVPAAGLAAARAVLRDRPPDLALLDMQVADGDGPALIPELVDRTGYALPVVILSGQPVPPARAGRAALVLVKGHDGMTELAAAVQQLLTARGDAR